jgi:amino acid permease
MSFLKPKGSSDLLPSLDSVPTKTEPIRQEYVQDDLLVGTSDEDGTNLHRDLKARHITMVRFNLACKHYPN